ncbi:hypothetical protein H2200_012922 [Cladophialophora chaetospira]|uniref:Zn(2)-C6 fungal-type domain-containing protein n=1 Tax=Cladophialophora chaetospira TaxID=386627 RepID=A0AA38WX12_9EURO|nr:hypothetical protein H2200_012922 [Cladophialophora chaetospira]
MSEADEGFQLAKRRRVARACDQCRHGKLRCDGGTPRCSKCLETRKLCSYGAAAKRRGLKTGYVRALECLWGLVLQKIEGSEAAVESLLSRASMLDFRVRDHQGDTTSGAESLLASWKASKIPGKINRLLTSPEDSEEESNSVPPAAMRRIDEHGPVLSWNSYVEQPDEQISHLPQTYRDPAEKDVAEVLQPALRAGGIPPTTGSGDTSAVLDQPAFPLFLKLPAGSRRLLDRYFTYTHSWLPIVERHVVFRTLYTYPPEGSTITRQSSDSGEHAVLWAIFACVSAELPQTETTPAELARSNQTSEMMYACARNLIPWENEHGYSLGHVQASIILALYRWVVHDYKASWFAISHAIAIALAIDLDQLATAWQYQRCPADRVWLGCFVMESLLAMRLRRVPYLKPQDVEPYLPIDESGPEEWEPWRPDLSGSGALQCQDAELNLPIPWTRQLGFQHGRTGSRLTPLPNVVNLGFVYLCLVVELCLDGHSDLETLNEYADLISQVCHSGASQMLPPSLELLSNAVSDTEDIVMPSREATLRRLQQDLSRLGLGSGKQKLKMPTTDTNTFHLHGQPCPDAVIEIPSEGRDLSRLDFNTLAADTICISRADRARTTDNEHLGLVQPFDTAAAQTDLLTTENLPSLTEEDPFLDYFELFDDPEM